MSLLEGAASISLAYSGNDRDFDTVRKVATKLAASEQEKRELSKELKWAYDELARMREIATTPRKFESISQLSGTSSRLGSSGVESEADAVDKLLLQDVVGKLASSNQLSGELQTQCHALKAANAALQQQCSQVDGQKAGLEELVAELKKELSVLQSTAVQHHVDEARPAGLGRVKHQELIDQHTQLQAQAAKRRNDILELQSELDWSRETIAALRKSSGSWDEKLNASQLRIAELDQQLQDSRSGFDSTEQSRQQLEDELDRSQSAKRSMSKSLEANELLRADLEQKLEAAREEVRALGETVCSIGNKMRAKVQSDAAQQQQESDLQTALNQSQEMVESLTSQIVAAHEREEERAKQALEEITALEAANLTLQKQCRQVDGYKISFETQVAELEKELTVLLMNEERRSRQSLEEITALEAANAALKEQCSHGDGQNAGLEAQVAELKKELSVLQSEMDEQLDAVASNAAEATGQQTVVGQLQKQLAASEEEKEALRSKVAELKKELSALQSTMDELSAVELDVVAADSQIAELKKELSLLQSAMEKQLDAVASNAFLLTASDRTVGSLTEELAIAEKAAEEEIVAAKQAAAAAAAALAASNAAKEVTVAAREQSLQEELTLAQDELAKTRELLQEHFQEIAEWSATVEKSTDENNKLQDEISELNVQLSEEKSKHSIDVHELDGMQEAMLKELEELRAEKEDVERG